MRPREISRLISALRAEWSSVTNFAGATKRWIDLELTVTDDEMTREEEAMADRASDIGEEIDPPEDFDYDSARAAEVERRTNEGVVGVLCNAAFLALWAQYESTVERIAAAVGDQNEVGLKLRELKGSFLARADKYFREVLRFELHRTEDTDWGFAKHLQGLRNALAHGPGRLQDLRSEDRRFVWAQPDIITYSSDVLAELEDRSPDRSSGRWLLTTAFLDRASKILNHLVNDLLVRVERRYGPPNPGHPAPAANGT